MPKTAQQSARHWQNLTWLWITGVIVVLDLSSKFFFQQQLRFNQPVEVIPNFFDFRLLYNRGAAFSFLAEQSQWSRYLLMLIACIAIVVLLIWLIRLKRHERFLAICLSFILGGAAGNLIDRLWHGYVIDFLSFHWKNTYYYPAFNLADSAIFLGAMGLILQAFVFQKRNT